jgi:hypothetical protein
LCTLHSGFYRKELYGSGNAENVQVVRDYGNAQVVLHRNMWLYKGTTDLKANNIFFKGIIGSGNAQAIL